MSIDDGSGGDGTRREMSHDGASGYTDAYLGCGCAQCRASRVATKITTLADMCQLHPDADVVALLTAFAAYVQEPLRSDCARLREALVSIANNSCCRPCREAALVARAALAPEEPKEEPPR